MEMVTTIASVTVKESKKGDEYLAVKLGTGEWAACWKPELYEEVQSLAGGGSEVTLGIELNGADKKGNPYKNIVELGESTPRAGTTPRTAAFRSPAAPVGGVDGQTHFINDRDFAIRGASLVAASLMHPASPDELWAWQVIFDKFIRTGQH